jgi:hypothetical protein
VPQFTTDSKVWRREHAIAEIAKSAALGRDKSTSAIASRAQRLEFNQENSWRDLR